MKIPIVFYRSLTVFVLMNSRAIWGTALAAVFVLSMIMIPAFAGAHLVIDTAEAKTVKGKSKVEVTTVGNFEGGPGAFGLGAIGKSGKVIAVTTHGGVGPDSEAQAGGTSAVFHTHVVTGKFVAACEDAILNPDGFAIASASFKEVGDLELDGSDIEIKNIPVGSVGKLTGDVFTFALRLIGAAPSPDEICIDVKTTNF